MKWAIQPIIALEFIIAASIATTSSSGFSPIMPFASMITDQYDSREAAPLPFHQPNRAWRNPAPNTERVILLTGHADFQNAPEFLWALPLGWIPFCLGVIRSRRFASWFTLRGNYGQRYNASRIVFDKKPSVNIILVTKHCVYTPRAGDNCSCGNAGVWFTGSLNTQ
jgi:hypothetical protein